jgi:hypothetical protein
MDHTKRTQVDGVSMDYPTRPRTPVPRPEAARDASAPTSPQRAEPDRRGLHALRRD